MFTGRRYTFASQFSAFFGAEEVTWVDVQEGVGRAGASGRRKRLRRGQEERLG